MNYKLFCLFSVLFDAILTLLLSFVFWYGHKFFDVINVCCCCLILPFVFARFLNTAHLINLTHPFLLHWVICFGGYLFVQTPVFVNNTWIFCVFPSVPYLVDNYAKIVDEGVGTLFAIAHYRAALFCLKTNLDMEMISAEMINSWYTVISPLNRLMKNRYVIYEKCISIQELTNTICSLKRLTRKLFYKKLAWQFSKII